MGINFKPRRRGFNTAMGTTFFAAVATLALSIENPDSAKKDDQRISEQCNRLFNLLSGTTDLRDGQFFTLAYTKNADVCGDIFPALRQMESYNIQAPADYDVYDFFVP